MGPLVALIVWGIVATPILIIVLILWRRKSPVARQAKKSILAAVAAIAIVFPAFLIGHILSGFLPSHVFESSFGFSPTRDVTDLQGYSFAFGDSGEAFLRFRANQNTINRIVAYGHFYSVGKGSCECSGGVTPPTYWRPFDGNPTKFYRAGNFGTSFSSSEAFLCYDESSGVAHFCFIGID